MSSPLFKAKRRIILASGSPRRRELLKDHFDLKVLVPKTDEEPLRGERPRPYLNRVSLNKWRACLQQFPSHFKGAPQVLISADTVVVLNGKILGKPESKKHATYMLSQLSGKRHRVITAVCCGWSHGEPQVREVTTFVTFRKLSERDLTIYLETGEWKDKAGAYGIQGQALKLVRRLEGSLSNVVGLPLDESLRLIVKTLSRRR